MATLRILLTIAAATAFVLMSTWVLLNRVVIVLVAVMVLSYLWSRWSLRGVSLSWSIPQDRAQVGQTLVTHLAVANRGVLPKPWLEIRDYSSFPGHAAGRVVRLGSRGHAEWSVEAVCRKRGRHHIGPMSFLSSDPFGVFPSIQRVPASIEITVYPPEFELSRFPIPAGVLTGAAATQRRTPFVTPSVAGIREYAPGDGFNRISWTATARLGRFMVKEFDTDPTSDVWIVLDCERAHRVDARAANSVADERLRYMDSTEEYAVAAAASVAKHGLMSGRGVGLIVSGAHREVIPAEQSERVRVKILESLAVATSDGQAPLADVLMGEWRRFGRHCGVVVVTSSSDPDWVDVVAKMHAHRVQVTALVVDGQSFGGPTSVDANIDRLAQAGVPTFAMRYGSDIGLALAGVA